eukprot:TRINITY_DN9190_c1_g5_i1.p2 TRINITY_DN9190_c1_g5~~TRINITY_DN9190_c1_g5_i1.p2  ORF type:complete len:226 (+),score=51.30 TRINITY_DN9190_c1_g5_i1:87-764(+)
MAGQGGKDGPPRSVGEIVDGGASMRPRAREQRRKDSGPGLVPVVAGTTAPVANESVYGFDIDQLQERPWLRKGADRSAWFNYGFDEDTWREYCMMQPHGQKALLRRVKGKRPSGYHSRPPPPVPQPPAPNLTGLIPPVQSPSMPPPGDLLSQLGGLGALGSLLPGLGQLGGVLPQANQPAPQPDLMQLLMKQMQQPPQHDAGLKRGAPPRDDDRRRRRDAGGHAD